MMPPLPRTATMAAAVVLLCALAGCGTVPTSPGDDSAGTTAASAMPAPAPSSTQEPAAPLPTGSAGTPRPALPDPKAVNGSDADAVSRAALTVMWTIDTRIDVSQHDATVRAAPYLTEKYAAEIKDTPPRAAPGAEWTTWAQHHAYTTVTLKAVRDAGIPPDTATAAYRQWLITSTPHGDSQWTGPPTATAAFVRLARTTGGPWQVEAVKVQ